MATVDEIRANAQAAASKLGVAPLSDAAMEKVAPDAVVAQLQDQLATAMQMLAEKSAMLEALMPKPAEPTKAKMYFSSLPFINVPIMRAPGYCENVTFIGGRLETSDPAVQRVLDLAILSGSSGFSHGPIVGEAPDVLEMKADINSLAAIAHKKMVDAGQSTG